MRILIAHSRYKIRGGEDEVCDAEIRLLQAQGHEVDLYEKHNETVATFSAAQMALRTIWSTEVYHQVQQRLEHKTYDLVHVHNFLPLLSPSIYHAARAKGVPVVQTLHNYRLMCPNALFFRNGQVCEDCLGQVVPLPGVQHACYRESRAASAAVATMLSIHRLLKTWNHYVDRYIALTEFARQKFIEGGLPPEKIWVKPNFVDPDPVPGKGQGGYALFVGRLSVEKGLDTLLAAWERMGDRLPLKIIGDGPLAQQVIAATQRLPNVEWLGRISSQEVYDRMGDATMLIFPSKWYETFGRVAIEAFAKGTPVVASNIGAIAELVTSGRTGLHFQPGDAMDLANKVDWLMSNPQDLAYMRRQARSEFTAKYTASQNYHRLISIYQGHGVTPS
jgi:glycosyltransferase involved in cell wall biosynthesis